MSSKKPSQTSSGEIESSTIVLWTKDDVAYLKKYAIKMLFENCDSSLATSKNLPINSQLIQYIIDKKIIYDIVQSYSVSKTFDAYYDKFGKDIVQSITYTNGRVNPNLYSTAKTDDVKRKRR